MATKHSSVDVEVLKFEYASALRKYSKQDPTQPPAASLAPRPESENASETKRRAAEDRESKRYLERLRFQLKDAGVSRAEIQAITKAPETMRARAEISLPRRILQRARTAVLVIHGIGEQNPYETLDQFARNLTRYLKYEGGIDDLTLSAQKIDHNDWVEAMIRLETKTHGPQTEEDNQSAVIDLYEYYWAPMTEDKINYKETLSWLIKTTLTPIRMLDQNVEAIEDEPDSENLTRKAIFYRELWRIVMLYLPLAALLGVLWLWLPSTLKSTLSLPTTFQDWVGRLDWRRMMAGGVLLVVFAGSAVMYWIALKQLAAKWLRWFRQQDAMLDSSVTQNTLIAATATAFIGMGLGRLFGVNLKPYVTSLLNWHALGTVAILALARLLQYFLADYVGDVAVYVNVDAKAKNYAVRRAILNGATTAITRLLKDETRAYDQIVVAGHSLGSVIAYDSLNELSNRCRPGEEQNDAIYATPDQIVGTVPPDAVIKVADLDKITGLVTFGSPLDKVYYFFREYVPESQSVRSQILALLRSFRTRGLGRDYGIYQLEHYDNSQLENITWLNAWSKDDPVSGYLHFYAPIIRREFNYLIPFYAHLSYWEDLRFYEFFSQPLLLGRAIPEERRFKFAVA